MDNEHRRVPQNILIQIWFTTFWLLIIFKKKNYLQDNTKKNK